MPNCPVSVSGGFSSTPVKSNRTTELIAGESTGDEDTFSLLSPIYHDSFDSDGEELNSSPIRLQGPGSPDSSSRCELPKSSLEPSASQPSASQPSAAQPSAAQPSAAQPSAAQPSAASLSAWETWVLSKAKEERLKLEKKAEEERILKEKEEQQEKEQERKRMVMEEKIQEWLKVKRKHMQEQLVKHRAEEEKMQKEMEKQREVEQKAQQRYNVWLQKKNQEKLQKEKKEKEIAVLKGEQEEERRRRAEEKFKEWLAKANEKSRASPESPRHQTSPYDRLIPAPSFYNPIPWKPIHAPPENPQKKTPVQGQGHRGALRRSNAGSTPRLLQRR
ncbi:coiled-coil domain-containing protein 34 isoform X2 [Oryzias latipes]|uniref:coiled-coil domain-containing protein 34 isoform X2 n=1 Tax=Oryzias latipes TaxID=8090 RepID=UPI0005CB9F03|nr:coiled-coil domain-containing protein 34 isoform X2 [Oryzias latipes]